MLVGLNPVTGVLPRRENRDIRDVHGGRPCDNEGRGWKDASASQGLTRIFWTTRNQGEARKESSLEPSERAWPWLTP